MPAKSLKPRADGRYVCKYKGKSFYGRSSDEAKQLRKEYIKAEQAGRALRRELTVREYALKWLPLYKSSVSEKCYNDYAKQIEALFPYIGNKHLAAVTVDDAAAVWQHYAGYSASTIKRARMLYIALFDTAIENELCHKNPFKSKFTQPPRGSSGSHRALTESEIDLILSTPHRFQLAVLVMLFAGLRRGEVLALSADDIDLDHDLIMVNKAVRYDSNQPIIADPKTEAGVRAIPIFSRLRPFLQNHIGLIAPDTFGRVMSEVAFRNAWASYIRALSSAAGHPVNIRPHDLRHTYCTMLVDAGVPLKQAMSWLGHADEKMILRVYDHVHQSRTSASIKQVEKLLSSRKTNTVKIIRVG
ncbi:MAG: site-specific integrase [Clostridia bacterium]|nr:site-specific integrase [Clostridia bacterium]